MNRREFIGTLGAGLISLSLAGCGLTNSGNGSSLQGESNQTPENQPINNEQEKPSSKGPSILVAYFSHTGNTRKIANQIHEKVGGDIFEIVTMEPYPQDHDACLAKARKEQASNYRPELKTQVENMHLYNAVFIGYPIWLEMMPMAVYTFLKKYNISDTTIMPFCTSRASGLGETVKDIKSLCPQSTVTKGLSIYEKDIDFAQNEVSSWLRGTGMII